MCLQSNDRQLLDKPFHGYLSRRDLLRYGSVLGLGTAALGAMPAAAQSTQQPKPGGKLTALTVADPKFLDIEISQLAQLREMASCIWDTLTYIDWTNLQVKPRLAKAWTFSDPKTLDLTLQSGVTFHDGQPFTADDVKSTFERILNPATGSPTASYLTSIDTIETVDSMHVRLHLKTSWPALPEQIATIQIYSKSATAEQIKTKPIGTGPFTFVEWKPTQHILLKKNPNYWMKGLPYLDQIEYRPVTEEETRISMMEAGAADVMFNPQLKDLARIEADKQLVAARSPYRDSGYILYLNNSRPPMNNQQLRLAASYALDRNTYFKAFLANQGQKNTSPWDTNNWPYDPINDNAFDYDLDKAKDLLAQGGYPSGKDKNGKQLEIDLVYPAGYPEWQQGSIMFQAAMKQLGVNVKVEELPTATWIDRIVTTDDFDMSWDFHDQRSVDPAWTLSYAFFYPPGPKNLCRYHDSEMTDLIQKGGVTSGQAARKQIYFQFQQRWNTIMPGLIVGGIDLAHAIQSYVKGFVADPLQFQDFREVWLDK